MKPYYDEGGITIYHGDCRDVLPGLDPAELVVADPPYNGMLPDAWDNQWTDDADFLAWMSDWLTLLPITPNGSLYLFCSPRLFGRVETETAQHFRVIGSIVWDKGERRLGVAGSGVDVTALRTYWHASTERVVFAEQKANSPYREADDAAKDACGYWTACEAAKRSVFGDYLRSEFARAGVTNKQMAALFPSRTGGLTGCVSNWLLGMNCPTHEQWQTMRDFLNDCGGDYLRREYEDLRREYEDLRREYEDLRRPFFLNAQLQWGDVWRFELPSNRHHPAEKPIALISQILQVSSRPAATILDPFMGSGTTLRAAKDLGRRAIGIEIEERYCEIAVKRLAQGVLL